MVDESDYIKNKDRRGECFAALFSENTDMRLRRKFGRGDLTVRAADTETFKAFWHRGYEATDQGDVRRRFQDADEGPSEWVTVLPHERAQMLTRLKLFLTKFPTADAIDTETAPLDLWTKLVTKENYSAEYTNGPKALFEFLGGDKALQKFVDVAQEQHRRAEADEANARKEYDAAKNPRKFKSLVRRVMNSLGASGHSDEQLEAAKTEKENAATVLANSKQEKNIKAWKLKILRDAMDGKEITTKELEDATEGATNPLSSTEKGEPQGGGAIGASSFLSGTVNDPSISSVVRGGLRASSSSAALLTYVDPFSAALCVGSAFLGALVFHKCVRRNRRGMNLFGKSEEERTLLPLRQ
ncbi:unnamed protein product [Amoebophrya sp. A25]|nr:unnamed protein product [Amoebophrya sp. A25]|eukprot:GSA25T00021082001.1